MVPVRSMSDCDNGSSRYHFRLLQRYQYTECQTEAMVQVHSMSNCDQYQHVRLKQRYQYAFYTNVTMVQLCSK
ncbi:hypothetical protein DPMN_183497 [Dreissena polymorpha]|uniref:Uncharacterized protein n=1 Tax=Dreissena polymorpha TaxID=45954 RepID=A0A9D4DHI6_DREPO|nr:hypothetical protein DPMN_183497 [Dreissena polymorpha]